MTPALNANTDDNPLAFTVGIDGQSPVKVVPVGPSPPGGLPTSWGGPDGFVANSIITTSITFNNINPGAHTLKVRLI